MGAATKVARKAGDVGSMTRYTAALAFASQLIHLWVLPGEFAARPLVGSFVLLAAVGQGMLAASLLANPGRWTIRFGLLLNATIVLAWASTRVAGFPALFWFLAAAWAARRAEPATAALYGLLVGFLVAVIFGALYFWPFNLWGLLLFALMIAASLLGALVGFLIGRIG